MHKVFHVIFFFTCSLLSLTRADNRAEFHNTKHHGKASQNSDYSKLLSNRLNSRTIRSYDAQEEYEKHAKALTSLLFPRSAEGKNPLIPRHYRHLNDSDIKNGITGSSSAQDRKLITYPCVICRDMKFCPALNGYQIEEVYLPYNLNDLGTCKVLDALGHHVQDEVFGNGRTFRDTPQCKDIVMQYLCLFYGSNNDMYVNHCIFQEDVSSSNPLDHKVTPRPPCRSFCVQVADVCATDPMFMQLCNNIKCPPMEDSCTPDPTVQGQVLAANIGCDMPYDIDPYFKKNSASSEYFFLRSLPVMVACMCVSLLVLTL